MIVATGSRWLLLLLLVALMATNWVSAFQSCPSICTCKWKNGKRWVECRNQGQISIPDQIDMETQVLDLSGNNLQILPREVFARHGLLNLQKLHLADCSIGQIDPTAFRGLTNLVELNLAGNLLTAVPTATFADIPYLRSLHLDRNPLQKVEANAFEMIPQLVSLDLSHCNIKRVAARAFAQLSILEKLFLQHNKITELRQKTVESIHGLHAVELANNPWACDCRLRPLKDWLISANVPHSEDPTCDSPPRLLGKRFTNLQVDEFACPPELLSAPRYVEANVGDNATLSCKIGSVPMSKIRWFHDGTEVLNNSAVNRGQQSFIIYENGTFEKTSWLILTNAQPDDSGPFMCVSQNQAGRVEANFTLQVGYFVGGVASLESGEIAGIAVTFTVVAVVLLILILVFLVRNRPCSPLSTMARRNKKHDTSSSSSAAAGGGTANGQKPATNGHVIHQNMNGSIEMASVNNSSAVAQNPTTRMTDLGYNNGTAVTTEYGSNGTVVINGTVYKTPNEGSGDSEFDYQAQLNNQATNPDLIPDNMMGSSAGFHPGNNLNHVNGSSPHNSGSPATMPRQQTAVNSSPAHLAGRLILRPSPQRAHNVIPHPHQLEADALYPVVDHPPRASDYVINSNMWVGDGQDYSNTLRGGPGCYGGQQPRTSSPFRSASGMQTMPRLHHSTPTSQPASGQFNSGHMFNSMYQANNPLRDYGYPSDYGLPMTANATHLAANPLSELLYSEESDIIQPLPHQLKNNMNLSNSSGSSTLSPPKGQLSSSGIGDTSIASGASSSGNVMSMHGGYEQRGSPPMLTSSGGTPTPTGSASSSSGAQPQAQPRNGSSSSWLKQQGGIQVLPPMSPKAQVVKPKVSSSSNGNNHHGSSNIRESPDEGIQDDVSTDV